VETPCLTASTAGFTARSANGGHSHAGAWERSMPCKQDPFKVVEFSGFFEVFLKLHNKQCIDTYQNIQTP
jgi:hypothetical protein